MPKLHEINALVSGLKSETEKGVTELYKAVQKEGLFDGFSRTYKPLDEEGGERLPPEGQRVQMKVADVVAQAGRWWSNLWDLVAAQDAGNQHARADVVVDGRVVLPQVPVTTLLFLEKQLNDVETFVSKLPTPDPAEEWEYDPQQDVLKTKPAASHRTKKVPRAHVLYEATDKHPAQVQAYTEDVVTGYWTKTQYTGRVSSKERNAMLARAKALKDAVKVARERANACEAEKKKVAAPLLDFVFGHSETK